MLVFLLCYCIIEWNQLNDDEKNKLRSLRARQGINCEVCHAVGYFRDLCPNGCGPAPVESLPSKKEEGKENNVISKKTIAEPVAYFWYNEKVEDESNNQDEKEKKKYENYKRANLEPLKNNMREEKIRLEDNDHAIEEFIFFQKAQEGYTRSLSEVNLHQVCHIRTRLINIFFPLMMYTRICM
jgi:hypothetical protein